MNKITKKNINIERLKYFYIGTLMMSANNAFAFNKLKNGFETITNTYLMPLTGAVAGAALITFITLSYFKQEENQKKVAGVFALAVMATAGLEVLKTIIQSFS
jgi:hypothetical protein